MKLTKFSTKPLEVTFQLEHKSDSNTITQDVTLRRREDWEVSLTLPVIKNIDPDNAVKQLGELLYRVSQSIMAEDGNFSTIELDNIRLDSNN